MCLDVSCLTNLPDMYNDMVGDGVPIAIHNTVILLPSITKFIGWTVGGYFQKQYVTKLTKFDYKVL
jgi:hypothetical protein